MTRTVLASVVVTVCVVSGGTLHADERDQGNRRTFQTTNLIELIVGEPLIGAATLFRSKNRLEMSIASTELGAAAYTVWWVIFNNPAACDGRCDDADLRIPEVRASVVYATGFVTGPDATANVTASLDAGALPEGVEVAEGTVRGLKRGRGLAAEVHLVIRHQDAPERGRVREQIGSLIDPWNSFLFRNWYGAVFMPVDSRR